MSDLAFCKGCLTTSDLVYVESNSCIQQTYLRLTNCQSVKLQYLCVECANEVRRCKLFTDKCGRAELLLIDILLNFGEISSTSFSTIDRIKNNLLSKLSITKLEIHEYCNNDSRHTNETHSDTELSTVKSETVKFENEVRYKLEESTQETHVADAISDDDENVLSNKLENDAESDDDIPLNLLSTGKAGKRSKRNKDTNAQNFTEITLSKEQQIAEINERLKSSNYKYATFKCSECYKGFVDRTAFDNHMEQHREDRGQWQCDVCKLRYTSNKQLRAHTFTSHLRRFQCLLCQHRSLTAHQAREHSRWHEGHRYDCHVCGDTFRKSTSRLSHMRKCHASSHNCTECGDAFFTRHGLNMHLAKTHRNKCSAVECGDAFFTRHDLNMHLDKTHRNKCSAVEESVPSSQRCCMECKVQFISLKAFNKHMEVSTAHLAQRKIRKLCKYCNADRTLCPDSCRKRRFNTDTAALYSCDKCPSKFRSRWSLRGHSRREHLGLASTPRHVVCETCGRTCPSVASLISHQRSHSGERPFPCTSCPARFSDRNQLRIHSRTHTGEKPYSCAVCSKTFRQKPALTRHMRVHTGVKPYTCQYCSKSFSQSNSMKIHVRSVHLKLPAKSRKSKVINEDVTKVECNEVVIQNL